MLFDTVFAFIFIITRGLGLEFIQKIPSSVLVILNAMKQVVPCLKSLICVMLDGGRDHFCGDNT